MKLILTTILVLLSFVVHSQEQIKDWNFVVFMNADNNLCHPFAQNDLSEMKSTNVSETTNLIVVYDCTMYGDSRIFKIENGQEIAISHQFGSEFDMGDYKFFTEAMKLILSQNHAKNTMVTLWNHGSGWNKSRKQNKGISYDDQSGNHINTPQVGLALAEISKMAKIDILGFDACLMQMMEIVVEVSPYVDYQIGSEYSEPGDGWNYAAITSALANKPDKITLGKVIVDSFVDFYAVSDSEEMMTDPIQLSMVDTKNALMLAYQIRDNMATMPLIRFNTVQTIYFEFKDMGSFLKRINNEQMIEAYQNSIVYSRDNNGRTSGMSVYLTKYPSMSYHELFFDQTTSWYEYLTRVAIEPPGPDANFYAIK